MTAETRYYLFMRSLKVNLDIEAMDNRGTFKASPSPSLYRFFYTLDNPTNAQKIKIAAYI